MAPNIKMISDYCRLCAVEAKNGVIIYSSEGVNLCLEEKIIQCLRIEVSKDDILPKKVCRPCRARLEDYHRFADRAKKVQNKLEILVRECDVAAGTSDEIINALEINHVEVHTEIESYSSLAVEGCDCAVIKQNHDEEDDLIKQNHDQEANLDDNEEFLVLPLDVTLKFEDDHHLDIKTQSSSDEGNVSEEAPEEPVPVVKETKQSNVSERAIRQTRRRKMLQPKKAEPVVSTVPKKRGRPRRVPVVVPPSPISAEEEPEDLDELNDEDAELEAQELEKIRILKGLDEGAEIDEEEVEELDDETDQKAKEEWKTHWGIKCNQCDQIFPFKSQFDKHYRQTYNKKPSYTCSYCNKTMEKYSTFRSHCYRHVTEGRYRCEYCQKGFSLRSMLHVHILAKHTTVKPFICENCGKGFVTRPGLNIHLKKHKTEEKSEFPCQECGKILHTRGGLTAHQNVHKLGRRFMCDVCGKTFTQKVNMLQHVKHHTGERPYACEKCNKCFAEKSHLNRHYSFHSERRPFQCKTCFKMYKTERCLKVHAMVHAELRPFVCTYCSKGFLSTTKLKQHNNIHTGERPFACKYCERTFTNYPNWLKHTRRRHKSDPRAGMGTSRGVNSGIDRQPQAEVQPQQEAVSQDAGQLAPHHNHPAGLVGGNASSMSLMAPYPHQPQPPLHQPLTQPDQRMQMPLNQQVYSEHMMAIHMPHHHHILPL